MKQKPTTQKFKSQSRKKYFHIFKMQFDQMKTGNTNKWTADLQDLKTINIYKNKLPRGGVL